MDELCIWRHLWSCSRNYEHVDRDSLDTHGLVSACYITFESAGFFSGAVFGGVMTQHAGFELSLTVIAGLYVTCGILAFGLLLCRFMNDVIRTKTENSVDVPLLAK
ncbi:uncharacterized protein LOC121367862 [Gigantopelta aegis]|uniref:uncharacterized protein LOC121367862 n=1 Tax=Gigantopelta aegis TaxID=1735272 RepID=UPI001B88C9FA|nr:uncharacterized protein LOC121367862 [Gigantopelta aegis]